MLEVLSHCSITHGNLAMCQACVLLVQGKPLLHSEGTDLNQDMKLQFPLDSATTVLPEISFQGASLNIAPLSFHFTLGLSQSSCHLEHITLKVMRARIICRDDTLELL